MKKTRKKQLDNFNYLLDIMDNLRENCPWDKEQTFKTLKNLTIEETYELSEALISNNFDEIKNELGDLLLHIIFYSKIASEKNKFDIGDVISTICEKLIRRHPHVFDKDAQELTSSDEVIDRWDQIKEMENKNKETRGKKNTIFKTTKPDLHDNLNKAFFDALEGVVWEQDQNICLMKDVRKIYGEKSKIIISIEQIYENS